VDFGTRFDIISKQMQLEFDRIRGEISHPEEKGKLFEGQFRRFLKEYFPKTLDISTGFIIDSNDKSSNQLDIVISDAARTPIFYQDNEKRIRITGNTDDTISRNIRKDAAAKYPIFWDVFVLTIFTSKCYRREVLEENSNL
jgi:hypothetical protein